MFSHRTNSLNIINMCGANITHAVVLAALAKTNLHWEMHHAQVYALEVQALTTVTTFTDRVPDEIMREIMDRTQTNITLMGLPVIIDNKTYPKGLVRLMSGDVELSRIECLSIPNAFGDDDDYTDVGRKREGEKFAKLTYKGD
jgi:hypothetical protein